MSTMPMPMMTMPLPGAGGPPNPLAPNPVAPAPISAMSGIPDWGPRPAGVASSNPDDFGKGGLLDQANLEFVQVAFTLQGPPTYSVPGQVFFYAKLRDLSDGVTLHDAWWTVGKQEHILPSQDGQWLCPAVPGQDATINDSTNYGLLIKSLADKTYPKNLLSYGNCQKIFMGLMIKSIRFKPEGRDNMKGAKAKQADDRGPAGVLICENILKFPWEAAPRVAIASRPAAQQQQPQQQYAPPAQQAPSATQATFAQYQQPTPAAAPVAAAPPFAPTMAAPPFAAPPAPPMTAAAPAAITLPAITDQGQLATVLRDTMLNLVSAAGPGGLPVPQIKVSVFRALQQSYDQNTVNTIATYAGNIAQLQQFGFVHDATADTIKLPG